MKSETTISRRSVLSGLAATAACLVGRSRTTSAAENAKKTGLGLVIYDCGIRRKWLRQKDAKSDLFEPLTFLQHCLELGAGGMQAALGVLEKERVGQIRGFAQQHDLFIDAIIKPPKDKADLTRFEAEIRTASETGVQAARTVIMPGRRYERFKSLAEFRETDRRGRQMLELAAAVVEKHQVPLAVENHKDQRIDERVALLKGLDSEFIGACVDTGNSFALLDGPYEAIEALAPFAFSVHLKDQALRNYTDGFLLGDIPLGQGSFDLKRMVKIIRKVKPKVHFALELITRDPLKVPCLKKEYFTTMPDVSNADFARAMLFVSQHAAKRLQQVSDLPLEKQVELEDANVAASLEYARKELGI